MFRVLEHDGQIVVQQIVPEGVYELEPIEGLKPGLYDDNLVFISEERMQDTQLRTLYVRRDVKNADALVKWAKEQGFETTIPASDMHVTIAFSRSQLDWSKVGEDWYSEQDGGLRIKPGGMRLVERLGDNGEAVVLMFASSQLSSRHEDIKRAGASWDWDEYQSHVTISYQTPPEFDVGQVEPYRGEIVLGPEIFEEVKEEAP